MLLNDIPIYDSVTASLFILLVLGIGFSSIFLAIINKAAVNIPPKVFERTYVFASLGSLDLEKGLLGHIHSKHMFNFISNCHMVFRSGCLRVFF